MLCLSPFRRYGSQGIERSGSLSKVTEPVNGRQDANPQNLVQQFILSNSTLSYGDGPSLTSPGSLLLLRIAEMKCSLVARQTLPAS